MTMFWSSCSLTPPSAILVCMLTTSSVTPCSLCSSTSPTQRMTLSPASSAARVRALTVWSVSPKYCLRSEWPMMTYSTPISASIWAEISPVKAPEAAQWQFCAPTWRLVPSHSERAVSRLVNGTQSTTSQPASLTIGASSVMSALAALRSLFIFQFPATIALRSDLFMVKNFLSKVNLFYPIWDGLWTSYFGWVGSRRPAMPTGTLFLQSSRGMACSSRKARMVYSTARDGS